MNKKAVLEGLLFVVGDEGISTDRLKEILEVEDIKFNKILEELQKEYLNDNRGIKIEYLGNLLKLTTKKEHKEYYEKLVETNDDSFLSQAALETLAIVAYNQPITRVEVDEIRGVSSSHMVRKLISKDLIKDVGRSDLPGRPILYSVTNDFLDYFGLNNIEELPKVEKIKFDETEKDLFESKYKEV